MIAGEVEVLALAPGVVQDRRQQDVLAALHRIGVDAEQRQHAGRGGRHRLRHPLAVFALVLGRRVERLEDRHRPPGAAARRVDREVGGVAQAGDALAVLAPGLEALLPRRRFLLGERVDGDALARGLVGVDPRLEVARRQVRERQEQVAEIALRVDGQHRHAVHRRFLDQRQAEAGLAAPGHADDHRVGDQVLRVVEDRLGAQRVRRQVERLPEVEDAELFVEGGRGRGHARILVPARRRRGRTAIDGPPARR